MTEKDLEIQDLRRENGSLKAQLAAAKAAPEIIHKPTVSEFRRMAVQLGYAPVVQGRWNGEVDGYADAESIVHCKECEYFKNYGKTSLLADGKNIKAGWCHRRVRYDEEYRMPPDGFCSYGKRRGGGNGNAKD